MALKKLSFEIFIACIIALLFHSTLTNTRTIGSSYLYGPLVLVPPYA